MLSLVEDPDSSSGLSRAQRLQCDSAAAWSDFVELYGPLVENWTARARLGQAAQEDIVQEVFLAVHRTIHRFDPSGPSATFCGWLGRVTRNAVLQWRRKGEAHPSGGASADAESILGHHCTWSVNRQSGRRCGHQARCGPQSQ